MSTKQELLSKFALQAGAVLPGIQSNSSEINKDTEVNNTTESKIDQDEELFKDSFTDRTKIPPWQRSKYKILIVSLCVIPAALAVALIFKNGVPKPKFETKAPTAPVTQISDDDRPKPATDGEWASYASTNGMHQQFTRAAESENTDAVKKIQNRTSTQKKVQAPSSKAEPNTRLLSTNFTNRVTPTRISRDDVSNYSYTRTYTTPTSVSLSPSPSRTSFSPVSRSFNMPRSPKHSLVSIDKSQQTPQPLQQRAPQERIVAILAATSTGSSTQQVASEVANNSSGSKAIVPSTSISTLSQSASSQQIAYLPSEAAVISNRPQTLIDRNQSAKGKLLTGIAFTSGDYASLADQPVEIELSEALGDIPAGTRIVAVIEAKDDYSSNSKSPVVHFKPILLAVGNQEIPLPDRAIALSGKKGEPLIAKNRGKNFLKTLAGMASTVAGSATMTNFGAAQNVQIGDSNYFKSIGANIATSLVSNAAQELQHSEEADNRVLTLKAGSIVMISVRKPISLPVNAIRKQVGDATDETQN